ncbi:hypothetical protein EBB79_06355 [Parasedimentitalea marina]|uniref:Uncharacterized protein n=1 Tax=Parasedimentitalea marina TaxID=2483033 RepID=A0A3T0N0J3_9RHOB|nr:hypothetical protein [Parasedimentitalea marina]AZV77550.1 hypothetical protein EBB79_06355 [Parasedimentitalea marina]
MSENFNFSRNSRSPQLIAILVTVYAVLIALHFTIDASWWIVTVLALPTLPAAWDYWRDTLSGLSLGPDQIEWYSGQQTGKLALNKVKLARFDTRWDFSVRVTFILDSGKKLRLPPQVVPPHRQLEPELQARGIQTRRHHFRVF